MGEQRGCAGTFQRPSCRLPIAGSRGARYTLEAVAPSADEIAEEHPCVSAAADAQGQPRRVVELLEQADSLLQLLDAALRIYGDEPQAATLQRLSAGPERGDGINPARESQRLFQQGKSSSLGWEAEEKEVVQSNRQPLRSLGVLPLHGPNCGSLDVGEISAERIRPERLDRCTPRSTLDDVEEETHVPITDLCWSSSRSTA